MGSAFLATILIIIATFEEEKNTLVGYLSILAFWVNTICARLMLKTMNPLTTFLLGKSSKKRIFNKVTGKVNM